MCLRTVAGCRRQWVGRHRRVPAGCANTPPNPTCACSARSRAQHDAVRRVAMCRNETSITGQSASALSAIRPVDLPGSGRPARRGARGVRSRPSPERWRQDQSSCRRTAARAEGPRCRNRRRGARHENLRGRRSRRPRREWEAPGTGNTRASGHRETRNYVKTVNHFIREAKSSLRD